MSANPAKYLVSLWLIQYAEGDHIKVTASKYPFPTVSADKASTDWFNSISRTLRWNEREKQKSFVVVEEEHEPPREGKDIKHKKAAEEAMQDPSKGSANREDALESAMEEEDEEDEEESESFDIDEWVSCFALIGYDRM